MIPTSSVAPSPARAFTLTGPYGASHTNPRAILLSDGNVLVVDGLTDSNFGPQSVAAELYDPKTNTFNATGSLLSGGTGETTTRLADGRVLLTGADEASSAEIYDPTTGRFSLTGPMVGGPRAGLAGSFDTPYTATLLRDGRVLIVGGEHNGAFLSSAELFDPNTGKFVATGRMKTARENHTATLLQDGRVLIVGGDQGNVRLDQHYIASAEIYEPATGVFSQAGTMITARIRHTATLLPDGRVLIAGGSGADPPGPSSSEIFDPATRRFVSTGSMIAGRSGHAACLLRNGQVLLVGGFSADGPPKAVETAELFDPSGGTFSPAGVVKVAPGYTSAVQLEDGRVLFVGDGLETAELYWP